MRDFERSDARAHGVASGGTAAFMAAIVLQMAGRAKASPTCNVGTNVFLICS